MTRGAAGGADDVLRNLANLVENVVGMAAVVATVVVDWHGERFLYVMRRDPHEGRHTP